MVDDELKQLLNEFNNYNKGIEACFYYNNENILYLNIRYENIKEVNIFHEENIREYLRKGVFYFSATTLKMLIDFNHYMHNLDEILKDTYNNVDWNSDRDMEVIKKIEKKFNSLKDIIDDNIKKCI